MQRSAHLYHLSPTRRCLSTRLQHLESLLSDRTRVVALVHVSNTLGCITDIAQVSRLAHKVSQSVFVTAVGSWVPRLSRRCTQFSSARSLPSTYLVPGGPQDCLCMCMQSSSFDTSDQSLITVTTVRGPWTDPSAEVVAFSIQAHSPPSRHVIALTD